MLEDLLSLELYSRNLDNVEGGEQGGEKGQAKTLPHLLPSRDLVLPLANIFNNIVF